ncbi:Ser-Thr-rich glycosyl-phosphatidyl-inositol-anchored membrane family-domain-containing protein, partial [Epithele typhae]|uniref:Ser-Thr-rich glycosyl-phosphatidyl-inositol-anchored membrane family-domain-containing protein n=1 Tax=Epithele typhae TaxID=378194 RepID=UPI002008A956
AMASLTPTAPGPGDSFAAGSACTIHWSVDTSGHWNNVSIYLMTGTNNNMTTLQTVASGIDGTDASLSSFNWTCPEVDPYSAIYIYQFTNGEDIQESQWTTRFTITSPTGESVPPDNESQPNGDAVPWGEGRLISAGDVGSKDDKDRSTSESSASASPNSDDDIARATTEQESHDRHIRTHSRHSHHSSPTPTLQLASTDLQPTAHAFDSPRSGDLTHGTPTHSASHLHSGPKDTTTPFVSLANSGASQSSTRWMGAAVSITVLFALLM